MQKAIETQVKGVGEATGAHYGRYRIWKGLKRRLERSAGAGPHGAFVPT